MGYTWTQSIGQNTLIEKVDLQEIRDLCDTIYNGSSYCPTYYASYCATNETSYYSGWNASVA